MSLALSPVAQAGPYSAAGGQQLAIGDQLGTQYDQLVLSSYSGSAPVTNVYELNPLTFTEGYNTNAGGYTVTGSLIESVTLGGITHDISVPYSAFICSCTTDSISILASAVYQFGFDTLQVLALGPVDSTSNSPTDAILNASITVPEPASLALLGVGAIGLGLIRRRLKSA